MKPNKALLMMGMLAAAGMEAMEFNKLNFPQTNYGSSRGMRLGKSTKRLISKTHDKRRKRKLRLQGLARNITHNN